MRVKVVECVRIILEKGVFMSWCVCVCMSASRECEKIYKCCMYMYVCINTGALYKVKPKTYNMYTRLTILTTLVNDALLQ